MDRPVSGVGERGHQAASAWGRGTSSGHSAPSGQLSENQRIARSQLPVFKSRPEATRSRAAPALKTMVETLDRERPRWAAYASATAIS